MVNSSNELETFVELENCRRSAVGKTSLSIQQDGERIQKILEILLSPDTLRGDGECNMRERVRLEKFYRAAMRQLKTRLGSPVT